MSSFASPKLTSPSAWLLASNLRLVPPPPATPLPAPSLILFIPSHLARSPFSDVPPPAERWTQEGFWVLECKMDEDGRDLDSSEPGNEGAWGWERVLSEGRDWSVSQKGVDETKPVGLVAHSPPVPFLLHLSSLPSPSFLPASSSLSQQPFSALILPGSTSLLPSLSIPHQSHLPKLPWDVPAFDEKLEVSLGDAETYVYEGAESRDWMCPAAGGGEGRDWRREDGERVYQRGGEFLRGAVRGM